MRRRAVAGAVLLALAVLPAWQGAEGHEVSRSLARADGSVGPLTDVTYHLHGEGAAPVIAVPRGRRVRLVLTGVVEPEMHLHGYDVLVEGEPGAPAVFEFDAAHAGRFPITAHGGDDLLGRDEKALVYVEVR